MNDSTQTARIIEALAVEAESWPDDEAGSGGAVADWLRSRIPSIAEAEADLAEERQRRVNTFHMWEACAAKYASTAAERDALRAKVARVEAALSGERVGHVRVRIDDIRAALNGGATPATPATEPACTCAALSEPQP